MEKSRIKYAKKNMVAGLINKTVVLLIQFAVRTLLIKKLGADYLGLNSVFSSILQVLNMAELGFSSAVVFSLYKPISENNEKMICALMQFYRNVYKIVGLVILVVGAIITPLLPLLINDDCPSDINIYILYWIFLSNTVFSYLAYAYKNVLLTSTQRQDIISNVSSVLDVSKGIIQIIAIIIFENYYAYIIWNIVFTVLNNIIISHITTKIYPLYICKGKIPDKDRKNIIIQIKGLAIGQVSKIARNSLDNIILAAFCGLIEVAIYSNYYYIMFAIINFLAVITQSISAGVGNSIATESKEKNYNDFLKINFYFSWISGWCAISLFCLYQPFMVFWVGSDLIVSNYVMTLFCVYFYIMQMGQIRSTYANAAGIWWEFRWLEIAEIFGNLILNIGLGYFWGMAGILWATIITVFIFSIVATTIITFKCYFNRSTRGYFFRSMYYFIVTVFAGVIAYKFCLIIRVNGIIELLYKSLIVLLVPNIVYFVTFICNQEHKEYIVKLRWIISGKL